MKKLAEIVLLGSLTFVGTGCSSNEPEIHKGEYDGKKYVVISYEDSSNVILKVNDSTFVTFHNYHENGKLKCNRIDVKKGNETEYFNFNDSHQKGRNF
ncbi:MAG: hypothetical protein Q8Q04_01545 [archaeon]|nr:hypothetical protein [archaeon]